MKYLVILLFIAAYAQGNPAKQKDGEPDINGSTISVPVTEINPSIGPEPPIPTTTAAPSTTVAPTTVAPTNATTTTQKPTSTTATTTAAPPPSPTTRTTAKTTALPVTTTTAVPPPHARKFDGPSFIGGIVLALGLVAIGFVAFKFVKSRSEMNYHTL